MVRPGRSGGSVWVMGKWSVCQWIVDVIRFQKIFGLYSEELGWTMNGDMNGWMENSHLMTHWPLTHHPHGPTNPNQNPPRRPDHFFTLWSSSQYKPYIFRKLTIHWPNDHRLLAVWAHPTWDSLTFGVSRVTTSSFFQSFFLQLCPYFCLLIQGPQCFSTLGVRFSQPYVTVAGPAPLWDLSQLPTSPDRY